MSMVDDLKRLIEGQSAIDTWLKIGRQIINKSVDAFMDMYERMLSEHTGQWTVFRGQEHIGDYFDTYRAAARAGFERFGNVHMLVRKITPEYRLYGRDGKPEY